MKKKPDIIIVDDHKIFQEGLKSMILAEKIANVVGDASNGVEFISLLSSCKPDLVLMDIDMPKMDGMEATQKALKIMPDLKIIALTMFSDEEYYYKMVDLGVKGFVLKSAGIIELEKAMHEVLAGKSYFSNEILQKIIRNFRKKEEKKSELGIKISPREKEILQEICLGNTTEEIASKLNLSPKTIKSHRANLLEKTACKNTASLIVFAVKNDLIDL